MLTPHEWDRRRRLLVLGVVVVAAVVAAAVLAPGAHSRATLDADVTVVEAVPNGQPDRLVLQVTNHAEDPIEAHVSTWRADRKLITYWNGTATVGPGATERVSVTASNRTLKPGVTTHLAINDGEQRVSLAFTPRNATREVTDGRD